MARDMTVGDAAKAAGVSRKAVRLYEAKGLLPTAERTDAGYRLYAAADVDLLRFIRQAKTLGLTLAEIGDVLDIRRGGIPPCRHVTALLDRRITEIDQTMRELRQLRRSLADTRARAADAPDDPEHTVCRIIERAEHAG